MHCLYRSSIEPSRGRFVDSRGRFPVLAISLIVSLLIKPFSVEIECRVAALSQVIPACVSTASPSQLTVSIQTQDCGVPCPSRIQLGNQIRRPPPRPIEHIVTTENRIEPRARGHNQGCRAVCAAPCTSISSTLQTRLEQFKNPSLALLELQTQHAVLQRSCCQHPHSQWPSTGTRCTKAIPTI